MLLVTEQARQGGFQLQVTAVPEDFDMKENEVFDPVYMGALYKIGYDLALSGVPWTDGLAALK